LGNGFLINGQSESETGSILENEFIFQHYSTEDGLSQNSTYTILQDRKGFLWFGTQGGVNRYNSYEFKIFSNNPFDTTSLRHSYVNKLYEDTKGRIWVCTEGGLSLFNPLTEAFINFTHDDSNPQSVDDNFVWTIFEDSKETLWVGTKKGLSRFDPDKRIFEVISFTSLGNERIHSPNVTAIFEDNEGNLWITSRGRGLYKIKRIDSGPITQVNLQVEFYSPGNGDVRAIVQETNGDLYAGTFGRGLFKYDENKREFIAVSREPLKTLDINPGFIKTLFYDISMPDFLWLGTEEDGVIIYNTKTGKYLKIDNNPDSPNAFRGSMVYSIYKDRSNLIWIGTNEGINLLNLRVNKFEHVQKEKNNDFGLSHNAIGTMIEDRDGIMWIGTDGGGLNKYNRSSNKFTHFLHNKNDPSSISSNRAMIVFEDHTGTIWVGTYGGGLNKFIRETGSFESYIHSQTDSTSIGSDYITSIVEDKDNYLWIGTTTAGINRFNPKTKKIRSFLNNPRDSLSISDNHVWILFLDKNNRLWAGTKNGGLNEMVEREKGLFRRYVHQEKIPTSLIDNTVFALYEDNHSGFWVGTNGGLSKLDRMSGEFNNFNGAAGPLHPGAVGILEDDQNRLWLLSGNAITRFDPVTNDIKIYDNENGMMINDLRIWSCFKNNRGEMFFGGANGFTVFHPDSLKDNSFIPPVVIDNFERFNTEDHFDKAIIEKGIAYRDKIKLSYKDNLFSFSFAVLNYINPDKNQYAYKLEGFNSDWINLGSQKKVTFVNIDPGTYTLRVKGSNDDGLWNEEGTALEMIISPPFWITWWFRSGIFLVIVFAVVLFMRNKLKSADRHHKEQEAFARQLIETEELERQRIANELHDSLGQNLLVIKNSLLVKQGLAQLEGKSLLETSELVSQTIQEVRTISHNLRPHLLDQLGLTKTIKSLAKQLNELSGINIITEVDDLNNALETKAEINLFRIIQETFNNIIKHSGASKAVIKIKRFPEFLTVLIEDNGKGMNISEIKKREDYGEGFGLYGMEKRAHVFNWIYEIDSKRHVGTKIKLTIPLKRSS